MKILTIELRRAAEAKAFSPYEADSEAVKIAALRSQYEAVLKGKAF